MSELKQGPNGKLDAKGSTRDFVKIDVVVSLAPRALKYGSGLTAIVFGNRVLLFSGEYLLGKHGAGSSSAGSKLGDVDSQEKLVSILTRHIDEMTLSGCHNVTRIPNIRSGSVVGTDSLVRILDIKREGVAVTESEAYDKGVSYSAIVEDQTGATFEAVVRYEVTRPGSLDGKFPDTCQLLAYSERTPPKTDKLNVVMAKIDPSDAKSAWLEFDALSKAVGPLEQYDGLYVVITVFPGAYAPAVSPQVDMVVGISGNQFWRNHALMKPGS